MKQSLCFLFCLIAAIVNSQTAELTPMIDIGTHMVNVGVPAKYAGDFSTPRTLRVPTKYTVSIYHAGGLDKPRFMAFSPEGVLHVSDMNAGKVFALPDADKNGVADTMIVAATGFSTNHDVTFYKGAMYVTETTRIWKCTDQNQDGIYETKTVFINNIGNGQTDGHVTRTLVFDASNQKAYVSVGSSCNVCRETARAIIEQYDEDGTNRVVYATGIRNAVGMAMHPVTNRLWANNNGSDQQGNEIPPEWIDIVRPNGFYGHPLAYGSGVWFNFNTGEYQSLLPITSADSAKVARMVQPAALIRAHSAPMALEFLNSNFGPELQYGFLSALRGSWNTTDPNDFRGYKVIYGHLSSAQDTTVDYVGDFCSGFITDTVNRVYWGRPVGIATDEDGRVYISSDEGSKVILVMTPEDITGITEEKVVLSSATIYPNPANSKITLAINLSQSANVTISIYDVTGKEVVFVPNQWLDAGTHNQEIDVDELTQGLYVVKINTDHNFITQKLLLID
ncbi:MAG TPA: T9SS type A sorting domain-containing protein [Saprospiraceae bacterium]|nr:T9SS type A sorting domain-containing protein [Saprospiraceae bacterium]